MDSAGEDEGRTVRPAVYAFVILAVFVVAVTTMGLRDGPSGAMVTALLSLAVAATAVGVWGTAMAVKETDDLRSRSED
ncbi:MAG: hypothetical protein ABSC30_13770 [Acidimicrobiales bacterium]